MSGEKLAPFAISAVVQHPKLKYVYRHKDGTLGISLGSGERYDHVALVVSDEEWRAIVRDVDQQVAALDNDGSIWRDDDTGDTHIDAGAAAEKIDETPVYAFVVNVRGATLDQARQVIAERINHDEDYGFPYTIDYEGWEEA